MKSVLPFLVLCIQGLKSNLACERVHYLNLLLTIFPNPELILSVIFFNIQAFQINFRTFFIQYSSGYV